MSSRKDTLGSDNDTSGYDWSEEPGSRAEPVLKPNQLPPPLPTSFSRPRDSLGRNDHPLSQASTTSDKELQTGSRDSIPTLTDRLATTNAAPQKSLSEYLIEKKYHPVLIFGDSGSGKSSLLASLFHYMQHDQNAGAICMLGDWILPTGTPEGDAFAEQASEFFNRDIMAFNAGQAAPATRVEIPFYIPVVVRPNGRKGDVRLAFLESRGEDYKIRTDTAGYFPEMKSQINDVYEHFPGPISLVVISPFTYRDVYTAGDDLDGEEDRIRAGDQALYGALQAYQRSRRWPEMDNYMFVLTKWDMFTGGVSASEFAEPPRGLAEKMIRDRYPLAWNMFRNMPQDKSAHAMQYSAGLIAGNGVITTPDQFKPALYRYPRALWNWLYKNASDGVPLYGERPKPQATGMFARIKKWLS